MPRPTITLAQYRSTARKVHAAYAALKAADAYNRNGVAIARTLDSMVASFDDVRLTACSACTPSGFVECADEPGWSTVCKHPKVPTFDVRTGEFSEV